MDTSAALVGPVYAVCGPRPLVFSLCYKSLGVSQGEQELTLAPRKEKRWLAERNHQACNKDKQEQSTRGQEMKRAQGRQWPGGLAHTAWHRSAVVSTVERVTDLLSRLGVSSVSTWRRMLGRDLLMRVFPATT